MVLNLQVFFVIVALIFFLLSALKVPERFNWVPAGYASLVVAWLVGSFGIG